MIKGTYIKIVSIDSGKVFAMDNKQNVIKLTRTQRNILLNYKSETFIEDLIKEFGNSKVIKDGDFTIINNDVVVYRK